MKSLVIAEKPSVARDIARVLGNIPKKGDWYENDQYIIAAALGHLVELSMPEDIDKKFSHWRLDNLPIIPESFTLKPIEKNKTKFQELKKLINRKDVGEIINACDAGREGELIFTYLYDLAGSKKTVKRLWLLSMTRSAIKEAFDNLRDGERMRPLAEAARCRSESDWLIGINGTRAVTKRLFGSRGRQVATVGRVQTPTLAIIMERENQIRNFVPRTYYRLVATFGVTEGSYEGIYQKPDFKKGDDEHDRADRIWEKEKAEEILEQVRSQPEAVVTEEKKRTSQSSPRLYDLTTLQREANGRYGFSAGQTLRIAQALYERHKVLTYPRTDSRALPEDYIPTCKQVMNKLPDDLAGFGQKILSNDWLKPNKRIFNNAQVSDHFAIIPTEETPKKLAADEQKIYDMVARRFLAVFFPPARFDVTTRISKVGDHSFKTEGKVLAEPGWLEVYGKATMADDPNSLIPLTASDVLNPPTDGAEAGKRPPAGDPDNPAKARGEDFEMQEETTKPPPRYTEATLLSAMEGAGKLVDDEELAQAMKEKGLGTPATRANIIDHLIREKYLERQNREIVPNAKAETLLTFLSEVNADVLTMPSLTGEWEHRLRQIEDGHYSRKEFMEGIQDLTRNIVDRTRNYEEKSWESNVVNPADGKPLLESIRSYRTQSGDLQIYKVMANRKLEEDEVRELLEKRQIGPLDGFRSKAGKPFSAMLRINDDEQKVQFVFDNDNGAGGNGDGASLDLSTLEKVGSCPKCGADIVEAPNAYICTNSRNEEKKCDFRVSRNILGREIPTDQMKKLLTDRKTDLLQKFWSKKSRRPFSAHLILKDKGGIGFEFPPREKKSKNGGKSAAKKPAEKKSAEEK